MSQFARPVLDITRTNWLTYLGGTTDLYDQINKEIRNDSEYVETILDPNTAIYVVKISSVVDPESSAGHIFRYAFRKDQADADQIDFVIQLRQGYVSEGAPGTLIKATTHTDVAGDGWIAGSVTLSGGEADSITNYTDLFFRMTGNTP